MCHNKGLNKHFLLILIIMNQRHLQQKLVLQQFYKKAEDHSWKIKDFMVTNCAFM